MWSYADYITYEDAAARLARLRLHIQEVSQKVGASTAAAGTSVDRTTNLQYLQVLKSEEKDLAAETGERSAYGGGLSRLDSRV